MKTSKSEVRLWRIKNILTRLFLSLPILLLFIHIGIKAKDSNSANPEFNPKKDTLVTVTQKDIKQEITLTGQIETENQAILRFQTSGELSWVGVKVGDKVKKYQAIASLNKNELQKKFQKEMNDYLTNRWNFEDTQDSYKETRNRFLVTDEIQRILDRTQFSLNNAVLDAEIANLAIKYATLYSPIDGIVTNVEQPITGINITPATAEFIIIDPQSIYFDSEIDEDEVNQIKVGQKATITIDSFSEESINSQITYISFTPKAGESSTTYQVKFELNNDNQFLKYRIGMNGDAIISIRESKNTLTLPIEAINQNEEETYVYIKKEGSNKELEKRIIKTGIESDNDIEILDGISKSDSVVIKGK